MLNMEKTLLLPTNENIDKIFPLLVDNRTTIKREKNSTTITIRIFITISNSALVWERMFHGKPWRS